MDDTYFKNKNPTINKNKKKKKKGTDKKIIFWI
jgi:hypothetical protein